jgi:hypothetical protein
MPLSTRYRQLLALQDLGVNARHEHFLIVRPVEDPDAPPLREHLEVPPQVVVVEFLRRGRLETMHVAALRVQPGHDVLDRPVLPGGIHGLKNDQQRVRVLRIQLVLVLRQHLDAVLQEFGGVLLLNELGRVARVVILLERDPLALRDDEALDELVEFHGVNPPRRTGP